MTKKGVLLINLGTPGAPTSHAVGRYLREFLMDPRVIQLPWFIRFVLVYGLIVPFRKHSSAHAYQTIWQAEGSPLLIISKQCTKKLQQELGSEYIVSLGMRYGNPSIESALEALSECESITVIPLYPQYASATTGSSLEALMKILEKKSFIPPFKIIHTFYSDPLFIKAMANKIAPYIEGYDFILFSYHGLPENQLQKEGCDPICANRCVIRASSTNCYRAQCYATTEAIAATLHMDTSKIETTFQSRLGRTPWIKPYTDEILPKLIDKNIKRLAVVCPSFVTDCLETLEEIGIQLQKTWKDLGGTELTLIPSLNSDPEWINALTSMIR